MNLMNLPEKKFLLNLKTLVRSVHKRTFFILKNCFAFKRIIILMLQFIH